MQYEGRVVRKPFAVGSKSEHEAVVLVTESREYVLRRRDGPAFGDQELARLVGKRLRCEGEPRGYVLFLTAWSELEP